MWGSARKSLWKRCSLRKIWFEQSTWNHFETRLGNRLKNQENKKQQQTLRGFGRSDLQDLSPKP